MKVLFIFFSKYRLNSKLREDWFYIPIIYITGLIIANLYVPLLYFYAFKPYICFIIATIFYPCLILFFKRKKITKDYVINYKLKTLSYIIIYSFLIIDFVILSSMVMDLRKSNLSKKVVKPKFKIEQYYPLMVLVYKRIR